MGMQTQVHEELLQTLHQHDIELLEPRDRMVQLNGVSAGDDYSKPRTNVLLRQRDASAWEIFVDEDFYYVGQDRVRREQFCGSQSSRWTQVQLAAPLHGDVNEAIVRGLRLIDSPIMSEVPAVAEPASEEPSRDDPDRESRPPSPVRLASVGPPDIRPTPSQSELAGRATEIVCRCQPPNSPVLIGPAGSGRTTLASAVAAELVRQKVVDRVVQISGAMIQCGTLFPPQRDKRLHEALCEVEQEPRTLLILEHLTMACDRSPVAVSIMADALERGLRLIATTGPGLRQTLVESARLLRRMEPLRIQPMTTSELGSLLEDRLRRHDLAQTRDFAPELIPVILQQSRKRPGGNPGAAVGLLEAVLTHAARSPALCVGPDEVYHVLRQVID